MEKSEVYSEKMDRYKTNLASQDVIIQMEKGSKQVFETRSAFSESSNQPASEEGSENSEENRDDIRGNFRSQMRPANHRRTLSRSSSSDSRELPGVDVSNTDGPPSDRICQPLVNEKLHVTSEFRKRPLQRTTDDNSSPPTTTTKKLIEETRDEGLDIDVGGKIAVSESAAVLQTANLSLNEHQKLVAGMPPDLSPRPRDRHADDKLCNSSQKQSSRLVAKKMESSFFL